MADLLFGPDGDLFIRTDIVRGGETRPVLRRSNGELFIENLDEGVVRGSKADPRTTGPIAFGPDGNLYAMTTSWDNGNSVRVFDGSTGDYLGEFINDATGGLNYGHLSFGPDGNLYVSSSDGVLIFKGPLVPEPSGLAMISLAMLGVTVLQRRRLNRTIHE